MDFASTNGGLRLTAEQRQILLDYSRDTAAGLALRAQIILAATAGETAESITQRLRISLQTVVKWKARFACGGVGALAERAAAGAPRRISREQVRAVVVRTLERRLHSRLPPPSTRGLAREMGLSQSTVDRIWRAYGLQPRRAA